MIKLKKILMESPDSIMNDTEIWRHDDKNIVFAYIKGKMVVALDTHGDMWKFYDNYNLDPNNEIDFESIVWSGSNRDYAKPLLTRELMEYAGRLFYTSKVITFWEFPPKNKLEKVLKDIVKEFNRIKSKAHLNFSINFDSSWKIEIITSNKGKQYFQSDEDDIDDILWKGYKEKYIPIDSYVGSGNRNKEDLAKQHILSPLLKKKKEVLPGWGSKFDKSKSMMPDLNPKLKYDYRAYWGDSIIKKGASINEKLTETPHEIMVDRNNYIRWTDNDAITFCYIRKWDDIAMVKGSQSHGDLRDDKKIINYFEKELPKSNIYSFDRGEYTDDFVDGRLWLDSKIISFWQYPSKIEYTKILKALKRKKIPINNNWQLEVYHWLTDNKILHINIEKYHKDIISGAITPRLINIRDYK